MDLLYGPAMCSTNNENDTKTQKKHLKVIIFLGVFCVVKRWMSWL